MANIFADNAGKLAAIQNSGLPAMIDVDGFNPVMTLVTSVGLSQGCNVQIQPSLDNTIFIYSFGDKMGSLRVGGVAFEKACVGGNSGGGAQEVLTYYKDNRISKTLSHIRVTVGGQTFAGFLVDMTLGAEAGEQRAFTYSLTIVTIPELASGSGLAGTGSESGSAAAASASGSSDSTETDDFEESMMTDYTDSATVTSMMGGGGSDSGSDSTVYGMGETLAIVPSGQVGSGNTRVGNSNPQGAGSPSGGGNSNQQVASDVSRAGNSYSTAVVSGTGASRDGSVRSYVPSNSLSGKVGPRYHTQNEAVPVSMRRLNL